MFGNSYGVKAEHRLRLSLSTLLYLSAFRVYYEVVGGTRWGNRRYGCRPLFILTYTGNLAVAARLLNLISTSILRRAPTICTIFGGVSVLETGENYRPHFITLNVMNLWKWTGETMIKFRYYSVAAAIEYHHHHLDLIRLSRSSS